MILREGDKLLICHRRLYERDEVRFFSGSVEAYDAGVVKLSGWTYLRDAATGQIIRKPDIRTRLYSLASGTILVYQLPDTTKPDALEFTGDAAHLVVTDNEGLQLNVSEHFGALQAA
jgi:hypothetical protein